MIPNKWKAKDLNGNKVIGYPVLQRVIECCKSDTPPYFSIIDRSYFVLFLDEYNLGDIAFYGLNNLTAFKLKQVNIQQDSLEEIKE